MIKPKNINTSFFYIIGFIFSLVCNPTYAQNFDKPGPNNTGPTTAENALKPYTGPTTITTDGTIIEGVSMTKQLTIQASNVTIRNFFLDTGNFYGIRIIEGDNIVIEDGIIQGMKSAAVLGSNFTARRLEIRNSGADGFKPNSNFLIESNWLHSLGYIEDAHADGLQMVNGGNGIVRGNNFDMPHDAPGYKNSQCFIISTNVGVIDNLLIEKNWVNGGGFSIQVLDKGVGYGDPTNIQIIDNRFGTDYQFGILRLDVDATLSGNVWDATGVSIDNQTDDNTDEEESPTIDPQKTIQPTISLGSDSFLSPQTVSIAAQTATAKIYYTLDGTTPTENSTLYVRPLVLMQSAILQAVAKDNDALLSTPAVEEFLFAPFASNDDWNNLAFPDQSNTLKTSIEFTPINEEVDSVVGLSSGRAEQYTDLAVIVRFSPEGKIDARNGDSYQAVTDINYEQGKRYLFEIDIDIVSKTYSVRVTPEDGTSVLIAEDYNFRTEQASVANLNNMGFTSIGSTSRIDSIVFDKTPKAPGNFSELDAQ